MRLLHSCPLNGVEQHLKSSFCLCAMLHTEPKHYNLTLAARKAHGSRLALQTLGAMSVAGEQHVLGVIGIPGDHGTLRVWCGRGGLERQGRVDKAGNFL